MSFICSILDALNCALQSSHFPHRHCNIHSFSNCNVHETKSETVSEMSGAPKKKRWQFQVLKLITQLLEMLRIRARKIIFHQFEHKQFAMHTRSNCRREQVVYHSLTGLKVQMKFSTVEIISHFLGCKQFWREKNSSRVLSEQRFYSSLAKVN